MPVKLEEKQELRYVGHSVPRLDAREKVTGKALFTQDIQVPDMLWGKVLRSPLPHARILSIDTSRAKRLPGVVAVVTGEDVRSLNYLWGHALADHPLLAVDKVRYIGEPVVGVAAIDERTAEAALELIDVEYDPLPFVTDVESALLPEAPIIHGQKYEQGEHRGFTEDIRQAHHPNIFHHAQQGWGDVEKGFAEADFVHEAEYRYPMCFHYTMEPYVCIADVKPDSVTVWTSGQHPYMVRDTLSKIFNLPLSQVRVIVPYVGGGYGGKSYAKIEPLACAISWKAGRPVKLQMTVEESVLTTRSDAAICRVKTGVKADGTLVAREFTIYLDSGAYAENSPLVTRAVANRCFGPYRIPHLRVNVYAVYTNTAPASSFRGFGAPQGAFAGESQIDEIADHLGIDPVDIRLRNLVDRGEEIIPGHRPLDGDLKGDLRKLAELLRWDDQPPKGSGRGKGIAITASDAGSQPIGSALVRMHSDGSVTVFVSSTEIGQGSRTVLGQIAAEVLQVPLERIKVVPSDTSITPYDRSTGASRSTTVVGRAVQMACEDLRQKLAIMAVELWGDAVEIVADGVVVNGVKRSWCDVITAYFHLPAGEVIGYSHIRRTGEWSKLPVFWELGVVGVEVSVDPATGKIRLERVVTVGDVGKAINPQQAEGQDIGAATMGYGQALMEELIYEGPQLLNGDMLSYPVPRFRDMPEFTTCLVENQDGIGPYGAKGGGEGALNPVPAAVANAVARAVGVRIREVPLTPERVWRALEAKQAR